MRWWNPSIRQLNVGLVAMVNLMLHKMQYHCRNSFLDPFILSFCRDTRCKLLRCNTPAKGRKPHVGFRLMPGKDLGLLDIVPLID